MKQYPHEEYKTIKSNQKKEGFWYEPDKPNYPIPIPNVLTEEQAIEINRLIKLKESECTDPKKSLLFTKFSFRIFRKYNVDTISRFTGKYLGNKEYEFEEFIWPGDFADHYVLEYKVKPTDAFLEWLGYKC